MSVRMVSVAAACAAFVTLMSGVAHGDPGSGLWTSAGQDLSNTRHQQSERRISVDSVADLAVKWVATTGGDVSATPAVDGSRVYVPDWAGNLYAFNRDTGALAWRVRIADATGLPGDKARAAPAVAEGKVFIGTQGPFGGGGRMLAYDKDSGHRRAALADGADARRPRLRAGDDGQRRRIRLRARPAWLDVRPRRGQRRGAVGVRERRLVPLGGGDLRGTVYWGSGYTNLGGTPNNKLYAFAIP